MPGRVRSTRGAASARRRPARGDDQSSATCASLTKSLRAGRAAGDVACAASRRRDRVAAAPRAGERADPLAPAPGRGAARCAAPRSPAEQERRGDDRARDERAGQAGAPHLLDQQNDVEERAAAAAELGRDQQARPAELGHAPPERVAKPRASSGRPARRSGGQCWRRNSRAVAAGAAAPREGESPSLGACLSARPAGRGRAPRRSCGGSRRCRRRSCGRGSSGTGARSRRASGAQREPARSGPQGPSRSMPKARELLAQLVGHDLGQRRSRGDGRAVSISQPRGRRGARSAAISVASAASRRRTPGSRASGAPPRVVVFAYSTSWRSRR